MTRRSMSACLALSLSASLMAAGMAQASAAGDEGLSKRAERELRDAGLDKYVGRFTPASQTPHLLEWTEHRFDTEEGEGPVCIGGTDYSVYTKAGDPEKVLVYLQGGGACWEGFPNCTTSASAPPPAALLPGVFASSRRGASGLPEGEQTNDLADWSVVFLPYCDGSVFTGDNDIKGDPVFGTRRHRGLRNLTAGLDVAKDSFGDPDKILVTGSSAGGAGAAAFAPFLTRLIFGNSPDLYVFNDAGPLALNPDEAQASARARRDDWQFDQFYPKSCTRRGLCDPLGQGTGVVRWRLDNDSTIQEAFYSTDADATNLFFIQSNVPGNPPFIPLDQREYRRILDIEHGAIHNAHPSRYKRYIVSGGNPLCNGFVAYTHTAITGGSGLQLCPPGTDLFFDLEVDGIALDDWTNAFVTTEPDVNGRARAIGRRDRGGSVPNEKDDAEIWTDNVEIFGDAPPLPR